MFSALVLDLFVERLRCESLLTFDSFHSLNLHIKWAYYQLWLVELISSPISFYFPQFFAYALDSYFFLTLLPCPSSFPVVLVTLFYHSDLFFIFMGLSASLKLLFMSKNLISGPLICLCHWLNLQKITHTPNRLIVVDILIAANIAWQ